MKSWYDSPACRSCAADANASGRRACRESVSFRTSAMRHYTVQGDFDCVPLGLPIIGAPPEPPDAKQHRIEQQARNSEAREKAKAEREARRAMVDACPYTLPGDAIHAAAERLGFQACEGCRSARAHLNLLGARLAADNPTLDGPALAALFIERHGDEAVSLVTKNAADHPVGSLIPEWAIRKRVLAILRGAFAERAL